MFSMTCVPIRLTTGSWGANFVIYVIFGFLSTSFVSSLPVIDSESTNSLLRKVSRVCLTPSCQEAADSLLANIDENVNPCDNFYQFACGNFIKNTVIPDDQVATEITFTNEAEKVYKKLKMSIEEEIEKDDPRSFKLVKEFYETCMDEDRINKNGKTEFLKMLKKLGGWPVLMGKTWNDTCYDWKETTINFRRDGFTYNYFIKFNIMPDAKNTSTHRIHLDPPSLGLLPGYLARGRNITIVKSYFKFMIDLAEALGADSEQAKEELSESLDFEIELAKISLPPIANWSPKYSYNPMTINDIQSKYPGIPYLDFINKLFSPHVSVSLNETVIVSLPNYLKNITDLLSRTPKRIVANYAFWRLVNDMSPSLGESIQEIRHQFHSSVSGNTAKSPRWKVCLNHVESVFAPAVSALYVRRHFDQKSKISASEMITNIRKSFQKMLSEVSWMDESTKNEAQSKLAQMIQHVGYPDEFFDNEKLDSYYESLKLDESLMRSLLNFNIFARNYFYDEEYGKPINKSHWIRYSSTTTINAYYVWSDNTILFPAAILNGLIFHKDHPKYMNYGGLGWIIGHEMTHGFDNTGRHFDKDGNLVDWWHSETINEYLRRIRCIVDQYNNYTVKEVGMMVNGLLTLGENIADNGGIKEAYYAYEEWEKQNGVEPHLPGMEKYTPRQMFWITNANLWCSKIRPETLISRILADPHAPNEYRVIGMVSNMPEFARDFMCPIDSPMNPVKKCTVW